MRIRRLSESQQAPYRPVGPGARQREDEVTQGEAARIDELMDGLVPQKSRRGRTGPLSYYVYYEAAERLLRADVSKLEDDYWLLDLSVRVWADGEEGWVEEDVSWEGGDVRLATRLICDDFSGLSAAMHAVVPPISRQLGDLEARTRAAKEYLSSHFLRVNGQ